MSKRFFSILLFLVVPLAHAVTLARTAASTLSVRSTPAGAATFSLPAGSVVGVIRIQGGWVEIVYLPNGNPQGAKSGWVSADFLEVVSTSGRGSSSVDASGDDCETDYDTDAEVCVSVTSVSLDCIKSFDGSSYRSCDVDVDYEVTTNYEGDGYLDVDVECNIDLRYKKSDAYSSSYDSNYESENHSLYSSGSETGSMTIDFVFSTFNEVVNAQVDSSECEIEGVSHY